MSDLPPDIKAVREVEDRAVKLGNERRDLDNRIAANTQSIIDLMRDANTAGVALDRVATLVGVARQTLYRWQGIARRIREQQ